jgi:hypothetical protein
MHQFLGELVAIDGAREEYARQFQDAAKGRITRSIQIEIRTKPPKDMDVAMAKLREKFASIMDVKWRCLKIGTFDTIWHEGRITSRFMRRSVSITCMPSRGLRWGDNDHN